MYKSDYPTYSILVCTLDNTEGLLAFIESLLRQSILPEELIVIHGDIHRDISKRLLAPLEGSGIRLVYVNTPPGLVHQRNIGLDLCKSELALFFDDDVILEPDYIRNLLEVYKDDGDKKIGGAAGLISNMPYSPKLARLFKRFFMLYTGYGTGEMCRSGMPSFLSPNSERSETRFFSGCLMSFRMSVVGEMRFDEHLHPYWWGDDFEFCYRVSLKSKLIQIKNAKLRHKGSSVNPKSFRKFWRMQVVNHLYIFKKHRKPIDFPFYIWSLMGDLFFAVLQYFKGYGFDGVKGYFEGLGEILGLLKSKPSDKWDKEQVYISYYDTSKNVRKDEWTKTPV